MKKNKFYSKENILLLILAILFVSSCKSKLKYLEKFRGFKSEPKIVESATYKIKNEDTASSKLELSYKDVYSYDYEGRLLSRNTFKSNGDPSVSWGYEYDKFGNQTVLKMIGKDSAIRMIAAMTYNKVGQVIETKRRTDMLIHKYDKKGNNVELKGNYLDGRFKEFSKFFYDEKGRNIKITSFKEDGEVSVIITKKYDNNGNEIEFQWFNSEHKLDFFTKNKYDNQNNLIEKVQYKVKSGDTVISCITKKVYEYDLKGNYTKQTTYINGKPKWLVKQNIIYHK